MNVKAIAKFNIKEGLLLVVNGDSRIKIGSIVNVDGISYEILRVMMNTNPDDGSKVGILVRKI